MLALAIHSLFGAHRFFHYEDAGSRRQSHDAAEESDRAISYVIVERTARERRDRDADLRRGVPRSDQCSSRASRHKLSRKSLQRALSECEGERGRHQAYVKHNASAKRWNQEQHDREHDCAEYRNTALAHSVRNRAGDPGSDQQRDAYQEKHNIEFASRELQALRQPRTQIKEESHKPARNTEPGGNRGDSLAIVEHHSNVVKATRYQSGRIGHQMFVFGEQRQHRNKAKNRQTAKDHKAASPSLPLRHVVRDLNADHQRAEVS